VKVFIRAYGSHLMGMGHLYRIKKIVNKLKERCPYCNITLWTRNFLESKNIYRDINVDSLIENNENLNDKQEENLLKSYLKEHKFDILINDQLNTSKKIAKILTSNVLKSITFDDLGDGNYLFDKIINVLYPSSNKLTNEINSYSYLILDDYSDIKKEVKFSNKVKTIFINQGAADTWGAIPNLIMDYVSHSVLLLCSYFSSLFN